MKDVYLNINGGDLVVSETIVFKAKNLLQKQIGDLFYAKEWGIDLKMFFDPSIQIQNETFESYSIAKMAENGINPISLISSKETFNEIFNYTVIEAEQGGLIR